MIMNVIDITDRVFTVDDREELQKVLRTIAKTKKEQNRLDLEHRASFLLKKAGGSEKFFRDTKMKLCEILR